MSLLTPSSCVLFWDLRPTKTVGGAPHKEKEEKPQPLGVPATFKHLDLTWKPHLRVGLLHPVPLLKLS